MALFRWLIIRLNWPLLQIVCAFNAIKSIKGMAHEDAVDRRQIFQAVEEAEVRPEMKELPWR